MFPTNFYTYYTRNTGAIVILRKVGRDCNAKRDLFSHMGLLLAYCLRIIGVNGCEKCIIEQASGEQRQVQR